MVNKTQIRQILKDHFNVYGKVTIDTHGAVSCTGGIQLRDPFSKLPITFDRVEGDFSCISAGLTTLEGVPRHVQGSFSCQRNKLTSLAHTPEYVGNNFEVWQNRLTSLKGVPQVILGNCYCGHNKLTTLEGAPSRVDGTFDCASNPLTTLAHAPQFVGGEFWLDYAADLGLLRMLVAQKGIRLYKAPAQVRSIMKKYEGQGKTAMLNCALELKKAGFEGNAKW